MDFDRLRPMETAPRDGREIVARVGKFGISIRIAWDGERWVSGGLPIPSDFLGWVPLPDGPPSGLTSKSRSPDRDDHAGS